MLGATVVGLGFVLLIILYIFKKTKEANELKAQLALMQATSKVEGLRADRKARKIELMVNREEAKKLDTDIAKARKDALAIVKDVSEMSDIQIAVELKKLGY